MNEFEKINKNLVLYWFDGPRVMYLERTNSEHFITVQSIVDSEIENQDIWIAIKLNDIQLYQFMNYSIDLYELFHFAPINTVYKIIWDLKENSFSFSRIITDSELPGHSNSPFMVSFSDYDDSWGKK